MNCPKCGYQQNHGDECLSCGIIFSRYQQKKEAPEGVYDENSRQPGLWLERLLADQDVLHIQQHALHWWEILFNWEQANEYMIRDQSQRNVGIIFENSQGFLNAMIRMFLGSHRPLDVRVIHFQSNEEALTLTRNFFFLFSDLEVVTPEGRRMGSVHRRFNIIFKKYDLLDERGNLFARISSPFWRLWTFPVYDLEGTEVAVITKKWSGLGKELFTDADNFTVDFGRRNWTLAQKSVLFAAALSIDFDFFENNNQ